MKPRVYAKWATIAGSLLAASVAFADEGCEDGPKDLSVSSAQCEDRRYRDADAALNSIYRERIRATAGDRRKRAALITSEREWIARRDKVCKDLMESFDVKGLAYDVTNGQCFADQTIERVKVLRSGQD